MALFRLGQAFTYQHANAIKKLWASGTEPTDAVAGEIYLDLSSAPYKLKRYNGTGWDDICTMTGEQVLAALGSVDGAGSGLDADKLDGQEGSFYRNAGNLDAGTLALDRIPDVLTGKGADKLDGQEGSFYRDASNLNAGTLHKDRLPNEAVRIDQSCNVWANTNWVDNMQVRLGSSADARFYHNGTDTVVDNYTGELYIRQLNHGSNIKIQAENASGSMQKLLTLDPDAEKVESTGRFSSIIYQDESIANNNTLDVTEIPYGTVGMVFIKYEEGKTGFIGMTATTLPSTMHLLTGSSNTWSLVKDTASRINVYIEGYTNLKIQNLKGSTVSVTVGFYGINKP